jgi:hypothetical protein
VDQHALMMRRRVAAGVAVVIVIVVVLVINGFLKSEKSAELKEYNHQVNALALEADSQVGQPLFAALAGAAGKSALEVGQQVYQLRLQAQNIASRVHSLSVPGPMVSAQRALLLAADLRVEGLTKIAALVPTALGGQGKQAASTIAGDMEILLASDVIYSQRVVPLIQQALAGEGISELSTSASRFVPNLGWLEPNTVLARLTGQSSSSSQNGQPLSGHHGSALISTSVGTNTLAAEPTINHISGGGSPTFTITVEDAGEFNESDVKVNVTVTASGKQLKASHVINKTEPGKRVNVEIPVSGIPLGVAAKIEAQVEPVPGETNHEGTKYSYLAIFSQ